MLTIIRGIPGSGKTTFAKKLMEDSEGPLPYHFEADDYFKMGGGYFWNPKFIKQAHEWCQFRTRTQLELKNDVIVSNTFIHTWAIDPYIEMCEDTNTVYKVIRLNTEYKNIHNVPEVIVNNMKQQMQDFVGEIIYG